MTAGTLVRRGGAFAKVLAGDGIAAAGALGDLLPGFRGVCSLSCVTYITSANCARIAGQVQRCQTTCSN